MTSKNIRYLPTTPNGRWQQRIDPRARAFLSETLGPVCLVIQNCGPGIVMLFADHGDAMVLSPGAVRATYAQGDITIENRSDKPGIVEFKIHPALVAPQVVVHAECFAVVP